MRNGVAEYVLIVVVLRMMYLVVGVAVLWPAVVGPEFGASIVVKRWLTVVH